MSLHVVDQCQQNAETIEIARALLALAEQGEARGLLFSVKLGPGNHQTGMTGDYWRDPCEAMAAASILNYGANQLHAARRSEPSTGLMPLGT